MIKINGYITHFKMNNKHHSQQSDGRYMPKKNFFHSLAKRCIHCAQILFVVTPFAATLQQLWETDQY